MGLVLAIGAAAFYSLMVVVARPAVEAADRTRGIVLSISFNLIFNLFWTVGRVLQPQPLGFSLRGLAAFALAGALTAFVGRWVWFRSVELIGPARAATFKNSQPLVTLIIAVSLLGETVTLPGLIGAAVLASAAILVGQEQRAGNAGGTTPVGVWWGLAAAASFGLGNIFRKVGVNLWPEPVLGATIGTAIAALAIWLTPQGLAAGRDLLRGRWGSGEKLYALTGVLASFAQQSLFQALQRAPVWQVNAVASMEPLLALVFAMAFLGRRETVTGRLVISVGMVCGGLLLLAFF